MSSRVSIPPQTFSLGLFSGRGDDLVLTHTAWTGGCLAHSGCHELTNPASVPHSILKSHQGNSPVEPSLAFLFATAHTSSAILLAAGIPKRAASTHQRRAKEGSQGIVARPAIVTDMSLVCFFLVTLGNECESGPYCGETAFKTQRYVPLPKPQVAYNLRVQRLH